MYMYIVYLSWLTLACVDLVSAVRYGSHTLTHGLPFECARSISIGALGMCLYIPWLGAYHFLGAQSFKCMIPKGVCF